MSFPTILMLARTSDTYLSISLFCIFAIMLARLLMKCLPYQKLHILLLACWRPLVLHVEWQQELFFLVQPFLYSPSSTGVSVSCGSLIIRGQSGSVMSFLVWQLLLSFIFLGRRYSFNQLLGCFLVAVGVIITVASGSTAGSLMEAGIFWSLLMVVSFLFQAADTIFKEIIFLNAAKSLEGGTVDLFVVNSFGSAFQAVFICLLMPFLSKLWGIPFDQLSSYLKDGAACFLNIGTVTHGCDGAPLLPLLFVMVNMGFNISLLHLLKISSAVVSCLASTVSVPIAVFLFTLPLPYLGAPSSLPPGFVAGAVVLLVGMLIYFWTPLWHAAKDTMPPASGTTNRP